MSALRPGLAAQAPLAQDLRVRRWHPYQVVSAVNWCGHALETIILPEDAAGEWFDEIPVLGEAT